MRYVILVVLCCSSILMGDLQEGILIETTKLKGISPYDRSVSPLMGQSTDKTHPMFGASPQMIGIPESLKNIHLEYIDIDLSQKLYQALYAGIVSREYFDYMHSNWSVDTTNLTDQMLKVQVGVVFGTDKEENTILIVDQNNNSDFSDDERRVLQPPQKSEDFWKLDVKDESFIAIEYEYYDGYSIQKAVTWLFVDNLPKPVSEDVPNWQKKIHYCYKIAEHSQGSFILNGNEYIIDVVPTLHRYRGYSKLMLTSTDGLQLLPDPISINDRLKIGNTTYVFSDISADGRYVTLVQEDSFIANSAKNITADTQIGVKAENFEGYTFGGERINLDDYAGKYVYLDFWGTWCAPCRAEIPNLKKVYSKYKNQEFEIIGIAKDSRTTLDKFLKMESIPWPLILQDEDQTIITSYNIFGYPTTFFIDPDGIILAKNLRGKELEKRLETIFNQ